VLRSIFLNAENNIFDILKIKIMSIKTYLKNLIRKII